MSYYIGNIDSEDSRTNLAWQRRVSRLGFLKAGAVATGLDRVPDVARAAGQVARRAGSPVTIRFMTTGGVGYQAYYKAAAAAFEKLHPEITVHLEPTQGDFATKVKVESAAPGILPSTPGIPSSTRNSGISPVTPRARRGAPS